MPHRPTIHDLVQIWRSHSKDTRAHAIANTVCRKFIACDAEKKVGGDAQAVQTLQEKQRMVARATIRLGAFQKQVKDLEGIIKAEKKN